MECTDDVQLIGEGSAMKIDESSLTGESLATSKRPGDTILAGAVVAEGELDAVVTATGRDCFFGKTMALLDASQETGHLQKVSCAICSLCVYVYTYNKLEIQ